jgi:hypothetical protein
LFSAPHQSVACVFRNCPSSNDLEQAA